MLQSEREAAIRAAGAKFKERKRKEALPAKSRLVGAALQAVARREERERLAKEAAGEEEVKDVVVKPDEEKVKGEDEGVEEVEERDEGPKREIPSCKYMLTHYKRR